MSHSFLCCSAPSGRARLRVSFPTVCWQYSCIIVNDGKSRHWFNLRVLNQLQQNLFAFGFVWTYSWPTLLFAFILMQARLFDSILSSSRCIKSWSFPMTFCLKQITSVFSFAFLNLSCGLVWLLPHTQCRWTLYLLFDAPMWFWPMKRASPELRNDAQSVAAWLHWNYDWWQHIWAVIYTGIHHGWFWRLLKLFVLRCGFEPTVRFLFAFSHN